MGQKFAVVDGEGRSRAFYDDEVNSVIPPEAFPISDDDWQEWLGNPATRMWNGTKLVVWKDTNDYTVELLTQSIRAEMETRRDSDDHARLANARVHAQDLEDDGDAVDFKITLHNGTVVRIQNAAQAKGLSKQALNVESHYMHLASGLIESVQAMTDQQRRNFDPTANSHWPTP